MNLSGSIVALITPFDASGAVDENAYRKLIQWHLDQGTDGIVCCGSTGEGATLTDEEHYRLYEIGVQECQKKIPVIASTGTNDTQKTILRTQKAKEIGADAALVIVPYYNRPTQRGIIAHFEAISKVGLPLIIYHNPARTAIGLDDATVIALLNMKGVVGFKDASGSVALIERLPRMQTAYFSGDDSLTIPMMERGACGVISVMGNLLPFRIKKIAELALQNKFSEARELYQEIASLCSGVFSEVNPQGIKYAVSLTGLTRPNLRLPLVEPLDSTKENIDRLYQALLQGVQQL